MFDDQQWDICLIERMAQAIDRFSIVLRLFIGITLSTLAEFSLLNIEMYVA